MANELLDSRFVSKKGGLLFKVDFYKAFDSVSWIFLDSALESFGFKGSGYTLVGARLLLLYY